MVVNQSSPKFLLGAMTLPYLRWSFDRALEGIARAGFRYLGIRPGHADGPLLPDRPAETDYPSLRRRIESYGLTPVLMFAQRVSSGDPAESLCRDVDIIAELGIPLLLHFPDTHVKFSADKLGHMRWFNQVEEWLRILASAVRRAERRGVTIVLKPHGGIVGTGQDLALIVERIGSPALRVCYDPGNVAYYEGVRPEVDVGAVAGLVRAVCIKDHRGGREALDFPTPGDGDIDHAAILSVLRDAGFSGACLIERIDGLASPDDVDRELARGRSYLERIVAEINSIKLT